jgi:hypothetical protein
MVLQALDAQRTPLEAETTQLAAARITAARSLVAVCKPASRTWPMR